MQIAIAIVLAILALVLFLFKKSLPNATLERAANVGAIISTIAACIVIAFYTVPPASKDREVDPTIPAETPFEIEYVGRVIDIHSQQPVFGAKVTLDLQGVPPVVYTDSEGIYRFKVEIQTDISGQIRVDAQGYQVYTRYISLSSRQTTIEDIRLTPQSSVTPPESTISTMPIPASDQASEELEQISIIDVQPSSGYKVPIDNSACLWTEASGQGAYIVLTLEQESLVRNLRVALNDPFVTKIELTFSDGSRQTADLEEIKDYEYQNVDLVPVRTSRITVKVLEVKNNSFSSFGICHIEVFGTTP
jgi:hypothetical protein